MGSCAVCGLPIKDGQHRCLSCGEPVLSGGARTAAGARHAPESICGKCGALLPGGCGACLVCGTERDAIPFDGKFPVAAEEAGRTEPYPAREGGIGRVLDAPRRWGGRLTALLLVVMAAVTGFQVWRQYFDTSGYRAAESVVYMQEDGAVLLSHPGLVAPVAVDGVPLADGDNGVAVASPNGRYLAVTTGAGALCQLDLAEMAAPDFAALTAARLADEAEGPVFYVENSSLLAYKTGGRELYVTDYGEHWRLDTDVGEIVGVEGRLLLYTRREESGRTDLYLGTLGAGGFREVTNVSRDIIEVLDWTPGFERILFTANHRTDGAVSAALLSYEVKSGISEALAEGIFSVIDASAANKTAFYLLDAPERWEAGQFINDDLAAADKQIYRPFLRDFPELQEAMELYGEDAELAEMAESETLILEKNSYDAGIKAWEDKMHRDSLRRQLRALFIEEGTSRGLYELWAYQGGANVRLDSGVLPEKEAAEGTADADSGYIVYRAANRESLRKARFSAVVSGDEPMLTDPGAYYLDNTREELRHARLTGDTAMLFTESGGLIHRLWFAVNGGSGVYFTVGPVDRPDEPGELFYADMRGGGAGAVSVTNGVNRIYGGYRDGLAYGHDGDEFGFASIARQDGGITDFRSSDRLAGIENGGRALLLYVRPETSPEAGPLGLGGLQMTEGNPADGNWRPIGGGGVTGYDYRGGSLIYFTRLADAGARPDLYAWTGKEERLLARRPAAVLSP